MFDTENYPDQNFIFQIGPIEAYASKTSYVQGDSIEFHVRIDTSIYLDNFTIEIFRKGLNDTLVLTDTGNAEAYPTNDQPYLNGCGWPVGYKYNTPNDLQSGAYIARFTTNTNPPNGSVTTEVLFIVKSSQPGVYAKILFQSAVNTAQAYNNWGGKSLYDYNSSENTRSYKVSFNRPTPPWDFYRWELPFIQWLDKMGYLDHNNPIVEFCTSVDIHAEINFLNNYNLFLSVGHDEYWSWDMRNKIDNFIENIGLGNIAFFSGNVCWWQVRLEDQDGETNRSLVCYKDISQDPEPNSQRKTINWYEQSIGRPENLMTGVSFYFGAYTGNNLPPDAAYKVSLSKHWLFQNTGLKDGDSFGLYVIGSDKYPTVGYETDAAEFINFDIKFPVPTGSIAYPSSQIAAPKDFMILAGANVTGWAADGNGTSGPNNHNGFSTIGIYRKTPNGGFGFTVGSTDWSNGLMPYVLNNANWNPTCQITKNILDTLGVSFQPQPFLLINPDFEDWDSTNNLPKGWSKDGAGIIEHYSPGHTGQYCLKVDSTDGLTWISQYYIPCRTGRQYRVRCWAKGGLPADISSGISIRLQTTTDYTDFAIADYTDISGNWQFITADGMINSSDDVLVHVRVKIQVETGSIALFDEVTVEEL